MINSANHISVAQHDENKPTVQNPWEMDKEYYLLLYKGQHQDRNELTSNNVLKRKLSKILPFCLASFRMLQIQRKGIHHIP